MTLEHWHTRPSLLSTWEHTVSGFDISGSPILDLNPLITQDNLVIWGGLPLCIPRACRLTKVCGFFAYQVGEFDSFDMEILKDPPCVTPSTSWDSFTVSGMSGGLVLNCFCLPVNVVFDACDVWAPSFINAGDWTIPVFRFNFHFELR